MVWHDLEQCEHLLFLQKYSKDQTEHADLSHRLARAADVVTGPNNHAL